MKKNIFLHSVISALTLCFYSGCSTPISSSKDTRYMIRMYNAPIDVILADYSTITGKRVDSVQGFPFVLTLLSEEKLTLEEYQNLVEEKLNENNVGLFPIGENRLVAAWIDPALQPKLRRPRRVIKRVLFKDNIQNQKPKRDAVRTEMSPNPLPLPKEMVDQMVKEGVIPPQKNNNPQIRRFYSKEELEKHLREQQLDAIRTGKEPLPIPLSPEMENQLIEEGVLEVGEWENKTLKRSQKKNED